LRTASDGGLAPCRPALAGGGKALPVLADLVTIVLVGRLAGHRAATARLLYATNPLALLVVAHHGQLEPGAA